MGRKAHHGTAVVLSSSSKISASSSDGSRSLTAIITNHPCRLRRISARTKVSSLTIAAAAFRVKGFMRFVYHRKKMREEIRRQYSRFFDGRSKRHFYSFHRTGEVSSNSSPIVLHS